MNNIQKGAIALSVGGFIGLATLENYQPVAYKDSGGVLTNGFGNTVNVVPNKKVSVPDALKQLGDNVSVAEKAVRDCIKQPMTQGQFDAFVQFTFNVGGYAFCKSTLVKKFNAGDSVGACNELSRWVYVQDKKIQGLASRREAERQLCLQ